MGSPKIAAARARQKSASGLSTAPHLDYRVQRNGQWIDPLTLASVPAGPLTAGRLGEFRLEQAALRVSLETGRPYPAPGPSTPVRMATSGAAAVRARQ